MTRAAVSGCLAFVLAAALALPAVAADEEPVPDPVAALAAESEDAAAAAHAAFPMGEDGDALVVSWLRDDSRRARLSPAHLRGLAKLAGVRGLRGANAGLRAIVRDADLPSDVRHAAVQALGHTGTIADVSALGDALPAIPLAALALEGIGGDTARAALRRNESPDAPIEVAAALVKMGDEAPLARLLAALRDPARDRELVAKRLRWATGRDLPAEPEVWETYARRRALAVRFADADATAAQAAVEEVVRGIGDPSRAHLVEDLCAILADTAAPNFARAKAALALGLGGRSDRKADLLAASVSGTPGDVRRAAIDALARVGDLSCAVPLVRGLVEDTDLDRLAAKRAVRQEFTPIDPAVVRALFRWGVPGGVSGGFGTLIEVLAGEYRTGLHRDAMRAFAEVSGGQVFGYEPDAAKPDRLAAVARMKAWWREARETLSFTPRGEDPGRAEFDRDVETVVRTMGELKFLYSWRAKMTLTILAEPAHERIVAALSDEDLHVRMGAAEVLENAGLRRSAAALARRLTAEPNAAARTRLLSALEVCGRPDAKGSVRDADEVRHAVRGALGDRNLDVRIAAARALGTVGDATEDRPRLLAARTERRNAVDAFRAVSAASLLRFGDRSAVADLVAELRSDDVARRAEALRLLRAGGLDVPGYDPDADPAAREAVVRAFETSLVPDGGRK